MRAAGGPWLTLLLAVDAAHDGGVTLELRADRTRGVDLQSITPQPAAEKLVPACSARTSRSCTPPW
ncbi:hypothetical protein DV701_15265 [Ornithinimicrobium avium]|uniref:Uncharacterized protein n=2 Tax=Ornithinimicrobium avium TaxID=2283195 RepID=A0A345NQI4_9MICO|nr:hypothetical protein DV701_15265 [Ornithinimicrobium avium]